MSNHLKVLNGIAVLLALSVAGLAGCSIQTDSAATKIAEFTLPPGYKLEATADLAGYFFVSYAPGDGHSHIQLIQWPQSVPLDQATLEQYMQQAKPGGDKRARVKVVGQTSGTIRGQAVTLVASEGTGSDGRAYRTLTAAFQGKGGPALLSIESPVSTWNQAQVDAFISSIR